MPPTPDTLAPTTEYVRSADGTAIAYERVGSGPALVIVDGAGCYRANGPARPLAAHLASAFTVVTYDRRGRGDSHDTDRYAVEREVEDLAAVVDGVGGSAVAHGISSGALLLLQAAAVGVDLPRLSVFEPPIGLEGEQAADAAFTDELARLVADQRHREAVEVFLGSVGVPPEVVEQMGPAREAIEAVAPTLVYDCLVSNRVSLDTVARVTAPTLVVDSTGSTDELSAWTAAVLGALPRGEHRSLPGQWHQVADADLAPVLTAFFSR